MDYSYYSEIDSVKFYVLGSKEIFVEGTVDVRKKDLFKGEKPVSHGCYDASLGTTAYSYLCNTCHQTKGKCPGHPGWVDMRYPVKSPLFREEILKWLKVVCFHCGRLIVNKNITAVSSRVLVEYAKLAKTVEYCPWADCGEYHPTVVKDKIKPSIFYADYKTKSGIKRIELFNNQIKTILDKISDETVLRMQKPLVSHPKNFILEKIRAPPVTIRPDIRRIGGSRSNNNDITALLKNIIEINDNDALPQTVPRVEEISKDLHEMYFNLDMFYYEMIKGATATNNQIRLAAAGNKAPNSIASRLSKKSGRIRKNLMGKRTHYMMRSVLSGDPTLRIDEIGVPINLARALQIPETVRPYNRERLQEYFKNKRNKYPGCSGITIKETGRFHRIDLLDPKYVLSDGDIVMRDLIEGDFIGFNRQPSLLFGNIGGHKIKIMHKGDTLRINVSACAPYNADFDGDACNGIIAQNIQSRIELQNMSWIGNWFISYQNHSPYFGCYQDSLIGSAELTRSDVKMDRWHAMQIFPNVSLSSSSANFNKEIYSGRDLVGFFLPKINFPKKKASMYLQQYAPFIKYDPDELFVQINRGQLISGTLDKSTVGQQVMGSIFHIINNEYGADEAITAIYNFHQVVNRFFLWHGFTVGIRDVLISDEAVEEIKKRTQAMKDEALAITKQLDNGEFVAPIGMTIKEYYEQAQLTALEPADNFVTPILNSIDFRNNSIALLIFTRSKGNESNMINMNGSYGQITINGERPPRKFSWGRTSPYFLRYDMEPVSCGFVDTSYREGIKPEVFPFAAGDARFSSISNALSTSVSGAQSRISIKNLESILVNNLRQSAKDENIVQVIYADSGIDPRKTENVKFLHAMISDAEMEEKFKANPKMIDKKFTSGPTNLKKVRTLLDEEFAQLCKDREEFRKIFYWAEDNNPGNFLIENTLQMPVNPYRIIEDVLYNYAELVEKLPKKEKVLDPFFLIKKVTELCNDIPYLYFNSFYKGPIPEHIRKATTLVQILIRSYLCTANLVRKGIVNVHVNYIVDKIKITFKNSLIDYGTAVGVIAAECLSEPLTQYVLDSRHRGGGGGGTQFNVIDRVKEILGGKDNDKMKITNMTIMVKPEYQKDKLKVQEIANYIEMMSFERFITAEHIFFEEYGNPVHPDFKHEKEMIKYFEKNNPGISIESPLSKWCIRYELNREEMIINSMKLETIITKLKIKFPESFIVFSPEKAEKIIIRLYIPQIMIKNTGNNEDTIFEIAKKIKNTIIRGIKGITYTKVMSIAKTEKQSDGSLESAKIFAIITNGSNLAEVLENPYVDPFHTQTNSIKEFEEMYGVEAAREKIIRELRSIMKSDKVTRTHTSVFADEMVYGGSYTAIQRTGLQVREANNVTLRLSFQSPIQVLENAAVNGIVDHISGVSGALVVGQNPRIGTCYNDVILNEKFIEDYYKTLNKKIEDEL